MVSRNWPYNTTTPSEEDTGTANPEYPNSAVDSGNYAYAGGKNAFRDYSTLVNIREIEQNTWWNPPLPKALDNPEFRKYNNPKGWFAADPMLITGYELKGPDEVSEGLPQRDPSAKDLFEFDMRRYGFRFLFNPPTVSEAYTNLSNVDPIAFVRMLSESDRPVFGKQSGASMDLELLVSRIDDMRILNRPGWEAYYDNLSPFHAEAIRTRGTMADIEYLFRLINGKSIKTWWSNDLTYDTSDWGIFLPRPILISLGGGEKSPVRIRGMISSMALNHVLFAPGMIPILTEITVKIERLLDNVTQGVDWDGTYTPSTADSTDETPVTINDEKRPNDAATTSQYLQSLLPPPAQTGTLVSQQLPSWNVGAVR